MTALKHKKCTRWMGSDFLVNSGLILAHPSTSCAFYTILFLMQPGHYSFLLVKKVIQSGALNKILCRGGLHPVDPWRANINSKKCFVILGAPINTTSKLISDGSGRYQQSFPKLYRELKSWNWK